MQSWTEQYSGHQGGIPFFLVISLSICHNVGEDAVQKRSVECVLQFARTGAGLHAFITSNIMDQLKHFLNCVISVSLGEKSVVALDSDELLTDSNMWE